MSRIFTESVPYTSSSALLHKYNSTNSPLSVVTTSDGLNWIQVYCAPFSLQNTILRKNLITSYSRLIVGFRVKVGLFPIAGYQEIFSFSQTAFNLVLLKLDSAGRLSLWKGDSTTAYVQLGNFSDPNLLTSGVIAYIELDVDFQTTGTGSYTLWVNGDIVLSGSSVSTVTLVGGADQINLHSGQSATGGQAFNLFRDIYLNDTSGSHNNVRIGDQRIRRRNLAGPGDRTAMTLIGAATNWQAVNELNPDGDTSYVSAGVGTTKELYTLASGSTNLSQISAIQVVLDSRKDDGGDAFLAPIIKTNGSEVLGTSVPVGTDYHCYVLQNFDINPVTGVDWTQSDIDALQIGPSATI